MRQSHGADKSALGALHRPRRGCAAMDSLSWFICSCPLSRLGVRWQPGTVAPPRARCIGPLGPPGPCFARPACLTYSKKGQEESPTAGGPLAGSRSSKSGKVADPYRGRPKGSGQSGPPLRAATRAPTPHPRPPPPLRNWVTYPITVVGLHVKSPNKWRRLVGS